MMKPLVDYERTLLHVAPLTMYTETSDMDIAYKIAPLYDVVVGSFVAGR